MVTNPTHIAVALKYQPPIAPVPVVLCMAADEKAQSVKAIAAERGIQVIENVALARALFASAEVDRAIPEEELRRRRRDRLRAHADGEPSMIGKTS